MSLKAIIAKLIWGNESYTEISEEGWTLYDECGDESSKMSWDEINDTIKESIKQGYKIKIK
jgi:hypothetical protein